MAQSLTAVGESINSVETIAKLFLMLTDVQEFLHFEDFLWGIQKNEIGKQMLSELDCSHFLHFKSE